MAALRCDSRQFLDSRRPRVYLCHRSSLWFMQPGGENTNSLHGQRRCGASFAFRYPINRLFAGFEKLPLHLAGKPNVLLELQQSPLDSAGSLHCGANVSLLSQYAAEEEVLFPPMTMLRVLPRDPLSMQRELLLQRQPSLGISSPGSSPKFSEATKVALSKMKKIKSQLQVSCVQRPRRLLFPVLFDCSFIV